MLFNVLFVVLVVYAVISPYFYIKFGMKIALIDDKKSEIGVIDLTFDDFVNKAKVAKHGKKPEMTRKDRQEIQKWENLMRYDGTPNGQVKISEVK